MYYSSTTYFRLLNLPAPPIYTFRPDNSQVYITDIPTDSCGNTAPSFYDVNYFVLSEKYLETYGSSWFSLLDDLLISYKLHEDRFFFDLAEYKTHVKEVKRRAARSSDRKKRNALVHSRNGNESIVKYDPEFYDGRWYNGVASYSSDEILLFEIQSHFCFKNRILIGSPGSDPIVSAKFAFLRKLRNKLAHIYNGNIIFITVLVFLFFLILCSFIFIFISLRSSFCLFKFVHSPDFRFVVRDAYFHFRSSYAYRCYLFFFLRKEYLLLSALHVSFDVCSDSTIAFDFWYSMYQVGTDFSLVPPSLLLVSSLVSLDLKSDLNLFLSSCLCHYYLTGDILFDSFPFSSV